MHPLLCQKLSTARDEMKTSKSSYVWTWHGLLMSINHTLENVFTPLGTMKIKSRVRNFAQKKNCTRLGEREQHLFASTLGLLLLAIDPARGGTFFSKSKPPIISSECLNFDVTFVKIKSCFSPRFTEINSQLAFFGLNAAPGLLDTFTKS
jgi:hypothetical protein